MHCSGYFFILILSSIVILEELCEAKRMTNDEDNEELQETRMLFKTLVARLFERRDNCPKPYHVLIDDGRCVWICAAGTQPDSVSNECVCQDGLFVGKIDQFGRRTCGPCSRPYHVLTDDERCVWSCSAGTQPDNTSNECVCRNGYDQTGLDAYGRRTCSKPIS